MKVAIRITRSLAATAKTNPVVEVDGQTVHECLSALCRRHPTLDGEIFDARGKLLLKWMLYINDQALPSSTAVSEAVRDGDVIGLVPIIAGGSSTA